MGIDKYSVLPVDETGGLDVWYSSLKNDQNSLISILLLW